MPSLRDLLSEASSREAFEVVMETGQPLIMSTARGGEPMGDPLDEDDLFAALTAVLSEEQQVELMVGNVIEFELDANGEWRVLTEPGPDGIAVRARLAGAGPKTASAAAPAGPSIDLPPVAPFAGGGIDLPPVSAEDSFSNMVVQRPTPAGVQPPATPASVRRQAPTVSDPVPATSDSPMKQTIAGPPLADRLAGAPRVPNALTDRDTEFEAFAGAPTIEGVSPPDLPPGYEVPDREEIEVDVEEEAPAFGEVDIEAGSDFALVGPPEVPEEPSASGPAVRPRPHDSATKLDLVPPPAAANVADTRSDLGTVLDSTPPISGSLAEVAAQLPLEGLVFVHDADVEDVAQKVGRQTVLVTEASDPVQLCEALHGLPPGSCAVVKVEDPGRWLGWMLRRMEEGYLALVQTRARTAGGAKRSLLGPAASVRAESWLGRHTVRSMIGTDGIWTLVLPQ